MQNESAIPMAELVEPEQGSQFSLLALFKFTVICGLILVGSGADQAASTFLLMGFALAMFLGRGNLALALVAGAILTAQCTSDPTAKEYGLACVCLVLFKAGLITWWFASRAAARDALLSQLTPSASHRAYCGWGARHGEWPQ